MTEEFLHYVWKYRLFSPDVNLVTGEPLFVSHPGTPNKDSGPDFFNARLRIGDTQWAGNIEIHVKASDWIRHHHYRDPAYNSIILHVVHQNDIPILGKYDQPVPTLEMKSYIQAETWKKYLGFLSSRNWIPCENQLSKVDKLILTSWLDALMVERLERKTRWVEQSLALSMNDWNVVFFRLLARNMGFKLNNDPFEHLSGSLSYSALLRHADDLFQLEAILFGQAGLLQGGFNDDYPVKLKQEYEFLSRKLSLNSMNGSQWKFMRTHPGNYPSIRLSQFAAMIHKLATPVNSLINCGNTAEVSCLFDVQASSYWENHFRFDKITSNGSRRMGKDAMDLLIINMVVPFLFAYGKKNGRNDLMEKALSFLDSTRGENNAIIRKWSSLGMDVNSASSAQAFIELKCNYCDFKKCLSCRIGMELLKQS